MVSIYEIDDNYVEYLRKYDNKVLYSKVGERAHFNQFFQSPLYCVIICIGFLFPYFSLMGIRNMREKYIIVIKWYKLDFINIQVYLTQEKIFLMRSSFQTTIIL